jgi:acetyltransferase-like isoleucine patch superfamily enzyme
MKKWIRNKILTYLSSMGFVNNTHYTTRSQGAGPKRLFIDGVPAVADCVFNVVSGTITVGKGTYFGFGCRVLTGQHVFKDGKFLEIPTEGNDIVIGKGCFIGTGTIISKKVTIGDNVLIGAGSVVLEDLPSGCFAAGNPCKVIRKVA